MYEMSGSLDFPSGVGTQMMMASASLSRVKSSEALSRPARAWAASAVLETSSMKLVALLTPATRRASRSIPMTVAPDSAKATASGNPT
jgi:hypothetical protein